MSKLQEYLYDQYDLILVQSEIDDILALARQEIELPAEEDIDKEFPIDKEYSHKSLTSFMDAIETLNFRRGISWALNKVRNPYPKPM
jgi:hypothetical protein